MVTKIGLSIITASAYGTLCLLFTTVSDGFRNRYDFVDDVGLVFLRFGIGQLLGLFVFGITSDRIRARMTKCNSRESKPEYRLPLMLLGGVMVFVGLLIYGWSAQYYVFWFVPHHRDIPDWVWDDHNLRSCRYRPRGHVPVYAASATAANTVFRSVGGGLLPLAGDRMYEALDQDWGNTLLAGISLVCVALIVLAIQYGELLRNHPRFQLDLS